MRKYTETYIKAISTLDMRALMKMYPMLKEIKPGMMYVVRSLDGTPRKRSRKRRCLINIIKQYYKIRTINLGFNETGTLMTAIWIIDLNKPHKN